MARFLKTLLGIGICLILFQRTGVCQTSPSVPQWVDDIGGTGSSSIVSAEKIDKQNNVYVTGIFSGTVDFDPSAGVKNLTSIGNSVDTYVAKYDTNGKLIWAVSMGGSGTDQPDGIDLDANGNVTISGQYGSPMDADPGVGVTTLAGTASVNMFLISLDFNGNFQWAKTIGQTGTNYGNKVAIDSQGNKLLGAQFQGTIDLGGGNTFSTTGTGGLAAKYDASGNLVWAFSLGTSIGDNGIRGIAVDTHDNVIVSGAFNGTVNFNPIGTANNLTSSVPSSFVAKYTPAGQLIWVQIITGNIVGYSINICTDSNDNIYAVAPFTPSLTFNTGFTINAQGSQDISLSKYLPDGTFQWAEAIGGSGATPTNNGITVSGDNNIYISGYFTGNVDFDPSPAVSIIKYHGQRDLFLAKYDTNGAYQWALGAGNSSCGNTFGRGIGVDSNNDVILSGAFCSTANFDVSGCSTYNVTSISGIRDSFIAKYVPGPQSVANDIITAPSVTNFCGSASPGIIAGSTSTGGTGVYAYQWQSSADGLNFNDISGAMARDYTPPTINVTTYYRRTVNSGTCSTPLTSNVVEINVQPTATIAVTNNKINAPPVIDFCATGNPSLITGSSPGGGGGTFSYQWQSSTDGTSFTDIMGATSIDYDPPIITNTSYYRRNVTANSCSIPSSSNIIIITISQPVSNNSITAPSTTNFCTIGDPGLLTGSTPAGGNGTFVYQWQKSADNITFTDIAGATAATYDPPVASVTTYYRRNITSGLCTVASTSNVVTITITPVPVANAGNNATICLGGNINLSATGGDTYSWTPVTGLSDATIANPIASPVVTTTYTVTVSKSGCSSTAQVTVTVIPTPAVDAGPDQKIVKGQSVTLAGIVTNANNAQYQWSPTTYLDNPNSLTPLATPPQDITYTLTVASANSCFVVTDDVSISVVPQITIPNTFSPNGDGVNDIWNITGLSYYANSFITIFNRYGVQVFQSKGYPQAWDGRYKGKKVPDGTYYYTIDLKDGSKMLSGWVVVIR